MTLSPHHTAWGRESAAVPDRGARRTAAVILDVDGTLVDSNDAHAQAWRDAFREAGVQVNYGQIRASIGMGGDKLMPYVSGISKDSPDGARISERRGEIFRTRYLPHLQPFPGVRQLVERFTRDGYRVVVASSADEHELAPLLDAAGVSDLIEARTSSDDADRSKPDPDIVQAALKQSGVEPQAAIMLGDTPYDVEAATRSGITVVGVECGGWAREHLCGAAEIYKDPAAILAAYDRSAFAQVARRAAASSPVRAAGRTYGASQAAVWLFLAPLIVLGALAIVRSLARRERDFHASRPAQDRGGPAGPPGLGPRERAELRDLISRTS